MRIVKCVCVLGPEAASRGHFIWGAVVTVRDGPDTSYTDYVVPLRNCSISFSDMASILSISAA
jgi:hypothetical protein